MLLNTRSFFVFFQGVYWLQVCFSYSQEISALSKLRQQREVLDTLIKFILSTDPVGGLTLYQSEFVIEIQTYDICNLT